MFRIFAASRLCVRMACASRRCDAPFREPSYSSRSARGRFAATTSEREEYAGRGALDEAYIRLAMLASRAVEFKTSIWPLGDIQVAVLGAGSQTPEKTPVPFVLRGVQVS